MLKRAFDIVFSIIGLLFLLPIFLIVSILIKLDSKGPVSFKQDRVGLGGRIFQLYKFRTMAEDADKRGPKLTMKGDPRITNLGYLLRWLKIDEFPQLFNILKGDISFVGPRPEIPSLIKYYSEKEKEVLSIKPGVTGPGQISSRDELTRYPEGVDTEKYYIKYILPEKIKTDLEYVRNHSFLNDLKFILQTVFVTFIKAVKLEYVIQNKRRLKVFCFDILYIALSYYLAFVIRFEGNIPARDFELLLYTLPILIVCRSISFLFFGLYRGVSEYAGVYDVVNIVKSITAGSLLFVAASFLFDLRGHSRAIFVIDWMLLTLIITGIRFKSKIFERFKQEDSLNASRVLIIGAGDDGEMLSNQIIKFPHKYELVGFLDDDPSKHRLLINGIPILGPLNNFSQIVKIEDINDVFVAISTIKRKQIRKIIGECKEFGINIKIVPTIGEVFDRITQFEKIREVKEEDLLGRKSIKLDLSKIQEFLSNKKILISGASGSIGSELSRQIARFNPSLLVLFERDENGLYFLEMELLEDCPGITIIPVIGDITDEERTDEIFNKYKPDIVFHAAAHKHVPLMEKNPGEAIKNNIIGTKNIALVSKKYGVQKFVLISTDKAVNPTSIMGMTKHIAEVYVHGLSKNGNTVFTAVRFGNVLGSMGSVVPVFRRQIERGGPVKVTHPNIVRYFMTIYEAAQLVIQAGAIGKGGEIFILKMGEPIKIVELARDLIILHGLKPGKDIEIVFEGLRPGEKMYEELYIDKTEVQPTDHEKIMLVKTASPDFEFVSKKIDELEKIIKNGEISNWRAKLNQIVP